MGSVLTAASKQAYYYLDFSPPTTTARANKDFKNIHTPQEEVFPVSC